MQDEPLQAEIAALLDATAETKTGGADAQAAGWRRFERRRATLPGRGSWRPQPLWLALAAGAVLIGALGFTGAGRGAAERVLAMFRINAVTPLPINPNALAPLRNRNTDAMIRQLLGKEVAVNDHEPNRMVADAATASQLAGFPVLTPPAGAATIFLVLGRKSLTLTVDRARTQALLDAMAQQGGPSGLGLPASLDHALITVNIPRAVVIGYGDCSGLATDADGAHGWAAGAGCTRLEESPSPQVILPAGVQMRQLAVIGLQLLGMSAAQARQYSRIVNWRSTLVVPFPRSLAAADVVAVGPDQGILLTSRHAGGGQPGYALIWAHDGMLYSIQGAGGGQTGLALASRLAP